MLLRTWTSLSCIPSVSLFPELRRGRLTSDIFSSVSGLGVILGKNTDDCFGSENKSEA